MSETPRALGASSSFYDTEEHVCAGCGGEIYPCERHGYISIRGTRFDMHIECFKEMLSEIEAVIRSHTEPPKAEGRTA